MRWYTETSTYEIINDILKVRVFQLNTLDFAWYYTFTTTNPIQ